MQRFMKDEVEEWMIPKVFCLNLQATRFFVVVDANSICAFKKELLYVP